MGTGLEWGGFPPTQTDWFLFFIFFKARFRVENGGSFSCSEAQNGNLKKKLNFHLVFYGKQT